MKKFLTGLFFAALFISFSAELFAIDFTSHGYYRNRFNFTYDLDTQRPNGSATINNSRFGTISFNDMRLRIEPILKLNDFLSVHSQIDLLDDLVYGTSDTDQLQILSPVVGTITLPAGAGSLSMVGGAAGENGSINVRRAWAEILTPIGKLKFGRQPSNWGLGIFTNDGNGLQADFGDSADRLMFVTQYPFDTAGALTFGALWDIAYEAQFDPRIQGLGGQVRDNGQDTNQLAAVIMYEQPEFTVGMFGGIRKRDGGNATTMNVDGFDNTSGLLTSDAYAQGLVNSPTVAAGIDGDTLLFFTDLYARYSFQEYNFQIEGVYLGGNMTTGVAIDAVPLALTMPGSPAGVIQMPVKQDVRVFMAAFQADALYDWGGDWNLKAGFAQGDATPLSQRITQYGFRPDYQIALMMFNMPLGTSPAIVPGSGNYTGTVAAGHQPITGNFINNAIYAAATYKQHIDFGSSCPQCNDFAAGGRVVTAFANKNPVELDFGALFNDPNYPAIESKGKWYGVEVDLIAEGRFFDYLYAALETGILIPGSAYDINVNLIDSTTVPIAPINTDKANLAYATRLTLMMQF